MVDEILAQLFGEAVFGKLSRSRRAQLLLRVFFGLLGALLGVIGAFHFLLRTDFSGTAAMRLWMVAVFVFLASFFLFNVALGRKWRLPGILFVLSFVAFIGASLFFGP